MGKNSGLQNFEITRCCRHIAKEYMIKCTMGDVSEMVKTELSKSNFKQKISEFNHELLHNFDGIIKLSSTDRITSKEIEFLEMVRNVVLEAELKVIMKANPDVPFEQIIWNSPSHLDRKLFKKALSIIELYYHVKRWNNSPLTGMFSILSHQFVVSVLCLEAFSWCEVYDKSQYQSEKLSIFGVGIYGDDETNKNTEKRKHDIFRTNNQITYNTIVMAAMHDSAEIYTGDVISPIKKIFNADIKKMNKIGTEKFLQLFIDEPTLQFPLFEDIPNVQCATWLYSEFEDRYLWGDMVMSGKLIKTMDVASAYAEATYLERCQKVVQTTIGILNNSYTMETNPRIEVLKVFIEEYQKGKNY